MRVFSQINNCQQKKNKKQTNKTKRGAPLLGLAKSIYYIRGFKNETYVTTLSCAMLRAIVHRDPLNTNYFFKSLNLSVVKGSKEKETYQVFLTSDFKTKNSFAGV